MQCWSVQASTSVQQCPCQTFQVRSQNGNLQISTSKHMFSLKKRLVSLPPISPGHETFSGRCLHSMEYKDADAFKEKRVIVVGIGNSGGDIASEISRHAKKVARMREALLFARKEGKM